MERTARPIRGTCGVPAESDTGFTVFLRLTCGVRAVYLRATCGALSVRSSVRLRGASNPNSVRDVRDVCSDAPGARIPNRPRSLPRVAFGGGGGGLVLKLELALFYIDVE